MTIQPVGKKIQIEVDSPTAGGLDLSSKETIVEVGTIIALGEELAGLGRTKRINGVLVETEKFKVGDRIFLKAWAIDIINYNKDKFYFIDADSLGICAIVKE